MPEPEAGLVLVSCSALCKQGRFVSMRACEQLETLLREANVAQADSHLESLKVEEPQRPLHFNVHLRLLVTELEQCHAAKRLNFDLGDLCLVVLPSQRRSISDSRLRRIDRV